MTILANLIGIAAVVMFVLSYQRKTRRGILFLNAGSRVFYVLQYLLLGAFEGAVLDIVALLVSLLARHRDADWQKKHAVPVILCANAFVIGAGLACWQNGYSLLPIAGVLFETGALWLRRERQIRFLSFFGAPFWLAYNLICSAYGSAVGNILTMVSIGIAIVRYDIRRGAE